MRVKSKVDLRISIVIALTELIIAVSMFAIPQSWRVPGFAIGTPIILVLVWIHYGTFYEFRDQYLFCRSGPFVERIFYDKIRSVRLCQNMASSMALSVKRIEIRQHGKGYITGTTYISPENREEFVRELISRCSNLES